MEPIHRDRKPTWEHDRDLADLEPMQMETKGERLFEELEPEGFKYATEGRGHSSYYDYKEAKKEAKRQRKLEK